ncbi:MAG: DUF6761 family protein [Cyanobacteria bacterium P01_H01_bin.21]
MLQDAKTIRYYQRITDALVDQWDRGYRVDDLRRYVAGYLAALRHSDILEPYLVHRLEDEVSRFMFDSSNFSTAQPQPEPDYR